MDTDFAHSTSPGRARKCRQKGRLLLLTKAALLAGLLLGHMAKLPGAPLALYETERSLVVLPLHNATGLSDLDYLSEGLARFVGSRLADLSYIKVRHATQIFLVNPEGQDLKSYYNRSSYLPQFRHKEAARLERLRLQSRILYLNKKNYKIWNERSIDKQARRLKADYLLKGSYGLASPYLPEDRYRLSRKALRIRLQLYNARSGSSTYFTLVTKIEDAYKRAPNLASSVRTALLGSQDAAIKVKSPKKGAMVFVDDLYLGRTPVEAKLTPGSYLLRVTRDGRRDYTKKIHLKKNKELSLEVRLARAQTGGRLRVTSSPSGAVVYLDWRRIGKTPLERDDLPVGVHRLRLSLPGHIDRISGVEIREGQSQSLSFALEPGHTETAFLDPNYVLFDWTYYDLSFYSFLGSLGFYVGYIGLDSQAQSIRQSIRTRVQNLSLFDRIASLQSNPALYAYEWSLIEANARRANRVQRQANVSAGLGGALLFAATYFFYKAVSQDEERDSGEISWFWESRPSGLSASSMQFAAGPVFSRRGAAPLPEMQSRTVGLALDGAFWEMRHALGWQIRF